MRLLTVLIYAVAPMLVATVDVAKLKNDALALRQTNPSTSVGIVCPPGGGGRGRGHCDQRVHIVPQINSTAAKSALSMHEKHDHHDESKAGMHKPLEARTVASTDAVDLKTATIMVCSGTYYTDSCDHPTITEKECKQMTVGSLVNGPPQAGGPKGMSSMWIGDAVDHCVLSCGLNCEEISQVGGFETWGNIEDMTVELLAPLDNMILSYRCFM
ncbi:hypothetical protein FKW77_000497 [Venturia effusa]|uniref:Uncharacterized protein n=1 Tax=Venturia effusa TaxID=50376 RepID=A0A517LPI4_9PEZI|nr:hypothetical protein FKW77_000497 [Venturia effusa]